MSVPGVTTTDLLESLAAQQSLEIGSELLQFRDHLLRRLNLFLFMDEQLAAAALHQWTQAFSHTAPNIAKDLQALRTRNKECDVAGAQHADGLGKALEGLKFEAGHIKALELFGGVLHKLWATNERESILIGQVYSKQLVRCDAKGVSESRRVSDWNYSRDSQLLCSL